MASIKEKDFVEIEYTGKVKDDGTIFDTTDEKTAKDQELYSPQMSYGPLVICVGEQHVIKGLDQALVGKETGKSYTLTVQAENAFGKKDAKLIQLIPQRKFREQNINPVPGLQVNVDGTMGLIKTVSGGRILVDFNHPLSSKDIMYEVKVNRIVEKVEEKVAAFIKLATGIKEPKVAVNEGNASISVPSDVPKEIQDNVSKKAAEIIPGLKKVTFVKEKQEKKETQGEASTDDSAKSVIPQEGEKK